MSAHPLAYDHMMAEKIQYLQENWQYLALATHPETGYKLHCIDTAEDAAALIAIVATDPRQIELFAEGQSRSIMGIDNDGRSIETIAALYQYHFEDVQGAMKIITAHLLAQDPQNLSMYDQALLHYTTSAAAFKWHSLFDTNDIMALADFCLAYEEAVRQKHLTHIGEPSFPAQQAISTLIAKAREDKSAQLLQKCVSYLPYLMNAPLKNNQLAAEGVEVIEMIDDQAQFEAIAQNHKEAIEQYLSRNFNFLTRISRLDGQTTALERRYPKINEAFSGFLNEYKGPRIPKL